MSPRPNCGKRVHEQHDKQNSNHCRQLMHLSVAIVTPACKPANDESSAGMILQMSSLGTPQFSAMLQDEVHKVHIMRVCRQLLGIFTCNSNVTRDTFCTLTYPATMIVTPPLNALWVNAVGVLRLEESPSPNCRNITRSCRQGCGHTRDERVRM